MDVPTPSNEMAEKFLERDFNQCFTQMRHYDVQIVDVVKFMFATDTTLIGVAVGLYQFSKKEGVDLIPAAQAILAIGFVFGLFMLHLVTRSRVYFVVLARYINEHRQFFLKHKPMGFQNLAGMYTNPAHPRYFYWQSSQVVYLYLVAALNSILLTGLLTAFGLPRWYWIIGFLASLILQVGCVVLYLKCRERKSGDGVLPHRKASNDERHHR
jgi:hypothetical protein